MDPCGKGDRNPRFIIHILIAAVFLFLNTTVLSEVLAGVPDVDDGTGVAVESVETVPANFEEGVEQEHETEEAGQAHESDDHGPMPPGWLVLPFVTLL